MPSSVAGDAGKTEQRRATAESATASISQLLMSLLKDLPGLISDRVHLLALELRRARQSFVQMALMVVVAAILAATAWVAFWAFLAVIVVAIGVPWYAVFGIIVLINCLGGWMAIRHAQTLVEDLTLPATVRHLTIAPSPPPASSVPSAAEAGRTGPQSAAPPSEPASAHTSSGLSHHG